MSDAINPGHYQGFSNGAQVIDITENLTFNCGSAVKYLSRAGRVDGNNKGEILEDLKKAAWYIVREIYRISPPGGHGIGCVTQLRPIGVGGADD